jgi:programmed cell death protein 5
MNGEVGAEDLKKFEEMKKVVMKKILSKQAIERMGRIRVVKPELAAQLELYLIQMYQAGKIKTEISDEQLKTILETLSSGKEFKILK